MRLNRCEAECLQMCQLWAFLTKHFQVIEQKISELEKKRMELESNLVNMLREKLEKNER